VVPVIQDSAVDSGEIWIEAGSVANVYRKKWLKSCGGSRANWSPKPTLPNRI